MRLTVPARFNGPPGGGNGGYVAGLLAAGLGADVATVAFRRPVPLDEAMELGPDGRLRAGEAVVAESGPGVLSTDPPWPRVGPADVAELPPVYAAADHPHPYCFGCGNRRPDALGLDLRRLPRGGAVTTWEPRPGFGAAEFGWVALDCPQIFSFAPPAGEYWLLGTISGRVTEAPVPGRRYVVTALPVQLSGRKAHAASRLTDGNREIGRADGIWIRPFP